MQPRQAAADLLFGFVADVHGPCFERLLSPLHMSSEGEQPTISLDDVSRALRLSTAATKAIIDFGVSSGKFQPRATKE